jgi:hypothetical protein
MICYILQNRYKKFHENTIEKQQSLLGDKSSFPEEKLVIQSKDEVVGDGGDLDNLNRRTSIRHKDVDAAHVLAFQLTIARVSNVENCKANVKRFHF